MPTSKFKVQRSGIRGLRFVIPVENGNPDSSELGYVIQTFLIRTDTVFAVGAHSWTIETAGTA